MIETAQSVKLHALSNSLSLEIQDVKDRGVVITRIVTNRISDNQWVSLWTSGGFSGLTGGRRVQDV